MVKGLVCSLWLVGALAISGVGAAQPATLPDFSDLVERSAPAVVNIRTTQRLSQAKQQQFPDLDENDPGWDFFRRFFPQPGPQPIPRQGPMPRTPMSASWAKCSHGMAAAQLAGPARCGLARRMATTSRSSTCGKLP